jgi:hypothetical protein
MVINDPEIVAEVEKIFAIYEDALLRNDNALLATMFLDSGATVRYGLADVQHGYDEIVAWRQTQAPFARQLDHTVVTSYGRDCATASTLFFRDDTPGKIGRQMQTWVRTQTGWKVAAAHVSMMDG